MLTDERLPGWEQDGCAVEPVGLAHSFASEWAAVQRHTARLWRVAAAMHAACGASAAEFVGDDLALLTSTHPRSGAALLVTALSACAVPELVELVEAGELSEKHVNAVLEEAVRWCAGDQDLQRRVLELTVARCRERVTAGLGWPTPGQLRARVRTAAVLLDLRAAERQKRSVAERRGVGVSPCGAGAALLSVQGPQVQIGQMWDAVRSRAQALGRLPGNARTWEQRLFDATHDLLCVDVDGGQSRVPALDAAGRPATVTVRGVEVSVLIPYSVAAGGDLELAELAGLPSVGPVLPSTARDLLTQAEGVRRIVVDARTGQVLAVGDRGPGPATTRPAADPACPGCSATVGATAATVLARLGSVPVVVRDLTSSAYRVPARLRRLVEVRDRTCTFPGCTVPGHWCDVDHREPWPYGPTSEANCHCLCRHHHRAKQGYFTVTRDPDGTTVWTTPDGRRYRRPPPTY